MADFYIFYQRTKNRSEEDAFWEQYEAEQDEEDEALKIVQDLLSELNETNQ